MEQKNKLIVTAAPHVSTPDTTANIMARVALALVPALIASIIFFGVDALVLVVVTVLACVGFEFLWCKAMKMENSVGDFSAVVTGLLLAFNMPASLPPWMAVVGAAVAILMVKMLFGGIGFNFANPAIVGRISLALGFTSAMTTYPAVSGETLATDAISAATPLATGSADYMTLFLGNHSGVLGETSALALLIGGIYLIIAKIIRPMIPVAYLATVVVMSLICGQDPIYQLLSGGLMLGAFFMATDYVTSPTTDKGKLIFGIGLGIITCLIRFYGSMAEGVSFAILLMNLVVPYIDPLTRQQKLGIPKVKKEKEAKADG
ncbi:MAG: RnfABCDGE type electron transport complex subunit D [Eubacteriales bacterium]